MADKEAIRRLGSGLPLLDGTVVTLTDNSGGTANDTLEDVAGLTVSVTPSQAEIVAIRDAAANNFADLGTKLNALIDLLQD